ncbi:hypothetical protein [Fulvimarina pelagi]|nr:hypothetical protein [Fulvimarina pelagi]
MGERLGALVLVGLLCCLVLIDILLNGRPLELMAAPAAALLLASGAVAFYSRGTSEGRGAPYAVGPVRRPENGWNRLLIVSVAIALISPRIGVPFLAYAIARQGGAGTGASISVVLIAVLTTEGLFAMVVGAPLPLFP